MFGSIGMPELILIFIVALLVFGPKKLPEIGKSIGKGLAEFKRASDDLKRTIEHEIEQSKAEVSAVKEQVAGVGKGFQEVPAPSAGQAAEGGVSVQGAVEKTTPPAETVRTPDSRPIEPS
jgi:sec-independent protein translocase protein TatA